MVVEIDSGSAILASVTPSGASATRYSTFVDISDDGIIDITHTLTSPGCPLGPVIDGQMKDALIDLPGVKEVRGKLTFSPPWDPKTMASDDVKMQLGIW